MRDKPAPPHPSLKRRPTSAFGWLDARLLHQRWLAGLGPDATAVLTLLALAADDQGASHWSRARMTQALRTSRRSLDAALQRLLDRGLVAHRPWRSGHADGVWQLLPLPEAEETGQAQPANRTGAAAGNIAEILRNRGLRDG